jgi:hypothetical protein
MAFSSHVLLLPQLCVALKAERHGAVKAGTPEYPSTERLAYISAADPSEVLPPRTLLFSGSLRRLGIMGSPRTPGGITAPRQVLLEPCAPPAVARKESRFGGGLV